MIAKSAPTRTQSADQGVCTIACHFFLFFFLLSFGFIYFHFKCVHRHRHRHTRTPSERVHIIIGSIIWTMCIHNLSSISSWRQSRSAVEFVWIKMIEWVFDIVRVRACLCVLLFHLLSISCLNNNNKRKRRENATKRYSIALQKYSKMYAIYRIG